MPTTGAFSDYVEDLITRALFFNTSFTPPTTLYLAAFTAAPTDVAGSGTEVTGGSYARVAMTTGTSGSGAGSAFSESAPATTITNAGLIQFPIATANWGTIVAVALFDAPSGGNMIYRSDKDSGGSAISILINTNDRLNFLAGQLSLTID